MGYGYQVINRITADVEQVTEALKHKWENAGLEVSSPEPHALGGYTIEVKDPQSENLLPLHIAEYTALADGHWETGSKVKVSPDLSSPKYPQAVIALNDRETQEPGSGSIRVVEFNEVALNKPRPSDLNAAMQGEAKNQTLDVAESIRQYLTTGGKSSTPTPGS